MSRDQILARVRSALAPLPQRAPLPEWDRGLVALRETVGGASRPDASPADPWPLFAERLKLVNGTPLASVAELIAFLEKNNYLHGYCDPTLYPKISFAFSSAFTVETTFDRARIDDYQFGITHASAGIAETGTLVLSDRDTSTRLAALAPWVHIAALRRDQIHFDIPSAIAALPADPNIVWVTGPSKTADVEGILIEGVHGPGVQAALLLDT